MFFPLFCLCVFVCSCVFVCVLVHMHQVWQVSWCALQVFRFVWLGLPSPYCIRHPSTRATWSLCRGSTACAAKPRRSTWGEVRRREGRKERRGGEEMQPFYFYSVLMNKCEMHWGKEIDQPLTTADFLCPAKLCRMFPYQLSVSLLFRLQTKTKAVSCCDQGAVIVL